MENSKSYLLHILYRKLIFNVATKLLVDKWYKYTKMMSIFSNLNDSDKSMCDLLQIFIN